jgi:hypothetical protein
MVAGILIGVVVFFALSILLWGVLNSIAHPKRHAGTLIFLLFSGILCWWLLSSSFVFVD